jgi:ribonuclease D
MTKYLDALDAMANDTRLPKDVRMAARRALAELEEWLDRERWVATPHELDRDKETADWRRPMTAEDAIAIHRIVHGEEMDDDAKALLGASVAFPAEGMRA